MKSFARRKIWPSYFDLKNHVADVRPAYASTIDKAQGSTHDDVFIDLGDISGCREAGRKARMMYVGITRARNNVFCYGEL